MSAVIDDGVSAVIKLAIDKSWLGQSGIGRVADEILKRKPEEIGICSLLEGKPNADILSPIRLARAIKSAKADVFWSPGFMPPLNLAKTIPTAITIHDLTHRHFYANSHRHYYDFVIRPMVSKMNLVFTVSDYSKQEIIEWSGLPESRVVRVYNGISSVYCVGDEKFQLGRPYVLYVGNRRSYKNIERLFRAYAASTLLKEGIFLALTGGRDDALNHLGQDLGIDHMVRYLGNVPEDDLPKVYRGALALAFVSLYEGFGLPIIEAMACGVPVLTSNCSSLPEIAGGAAILIDPYSIADIADGLEQVCWNDFSRRKCIENGLLRAMDFSWDKTAAAYWSNIKSLC